MPTVLSIKSYVLYGTAEGKIKIIIIIIIITKFWRLIARDTTVLFTGAENSAA